MDHSHCLADETLVALAFDVGTPEPGAVQHLAGCDPCASRAEPLLQAARAVSLSAGDRAGRIACLDEGRLAELAEQGGALGPADIAHLAGCARCSAALAALLGLLDDPQIKQALHETDRPHRNWSRGGIIGSALGATTLAAALLAGVMLRPDAVPSGPLPEPASHRQSGAAAEIAPRIVAPILPGTVADTLRWTSVPFADRYQVLMFDREGTLAWEVQTSDTAIALPQHLRTGAAAYLWKVEARTDWNRWVASEWAELAIPARRPQVR